MHLGAVFFVLGSLMSILGIALWLPILVALFIPTDTLFETSQFVGLGVTSALGLTLGQAIRFTTKKYAGKVGVREGFAIVSFAWVIMSLLGMLPYLISGVTTSVTDAFFETMSGFTTTGATIFPEIEIMPAGILVWRSMTQWLGGMGIVVLSIALLPILGVGGYRLMKAESPGGVAYERETPRITDAAKELWILYVALTAILMVILVFLGMSPLDAICHGFTTLATGGFSTHTESIGYFQDSAIHWVLITFMLIGGLNFSIYSQIIRRRFKFLLRDVEFRAFIGLVVLGVTFFFPKGGASRFWRILARISYSCHTSNRPKSNTPRRGRKFQRKSSGSIRLRVSSRLITQRHVRNRANTLPGVCFRLLPNFRCGVFG